MVENWQLWSKWPKWVENGLESVQMAFKIEGFFNGQNPLQLGVLTKKTNFHYFQNNVSWYMKFLHTHIGWKRCVLLNMENVKSYPLLFIRKSVKSHGAVAARSWHLSSWPGRPHWEKMSGSLRVRGVFANSCGMRSLSPHKVRYSQQASFMSNYKFPSFVLYF